MKEDVKAKIYEPTPKNIAFLAEHLCAGELVAFPTETVYGLGANVFDSNAVTRVFETKERPQFDPLIVHIGMPPGSNESGLSQPASEYLVGLGLMDARVLGTRRAARIDKLADQFWPGPLTLVVPRGERVNDLVTSGLPSVAVRMPQHPVTLQLLRSAQVPLVGPSANRFGRISPTTANDVQFELGSRISHILDGGRCEIGVESTVLMITETDLICLRPGGTALEMIETALNQKVQAANNTRYDQPQGPGQLKSHYAPEKRVHLLNKPVLKMTDVDWIDLQSSLNVEDMVGCLAFQGETREISNRVSQALGQMCVVKVLSPSGSMREAAHLLFGSLRVLDLAPVSIILAEPIPTQTGLARAIQDRLAKAAGPRD